jgi:uncharacterized protein
MGARQEHLSSTSVEGSRPCSKIRFGFGLVWHSRSRPSFHQFRYRAFFMAVSARDLVGPARGNWLFGINRPALISLSLDDHILEAGESLSDTLTKLFGSDDVMLYAFAKVLGYQFKPVSFWVSDKKVLAEVHNTFGERHAYLLARDRPLRAEKCFHVSPFCDVKGRYEFDVRSSLDQFSAGIDYFDLDDSPALIRTRMSGQLVPVTLATSLQALIGYPFFSLGVIARIHWQALRLWIKKVPWFSKPVPPLTALTHAIDFTAKNDQS